jgi:hypothetical protein
MNIGVTAITYLKATFPSNVATVRYAGQNGSLDGSVEAFCAGIERTRAQTEEGLYNGADASIRYLSSAEPTAWANAINGQVIELQFADTDEWIRLRVTNRKALQGAVRLNVTAEFEEV